MAGTYITINDRLTGQRKIFRKERDRLKEIDKELETEINNMFNSLVNHPPGNDENRYRALAWYTTKINTRNLVQENIEYLDHILRNLEVAIETGNYHYIGSIRPYNEN